MRLASGLAASALSLSAAALFACSSFTAGEAADGGAGDSASTADGAVVDAGAGTLIVTGQAGATEIVADDTHVIWNLPGDDGGVRLAPITVSATPLALTSAMAAPHSLQLAVNQVYFASGETVYFAMTDGSMAATGARSVTPQGTGTVLTASSFVADDVTFVKNGDAHLYWCPNGACGANNPQQQDVGASIVGLVPDPTVSTTLWVSTDSSIRPLDSGNQFNEGTSFILPTAGATAGTIRTFTLDDVSIFYATTTSGDIFAASKSMPTAPRLVMSLPPTNGAVAAPWALAVDAKNLYVAVLNQGVVVKVDKNNGGTPITIASGLTEPRALALTTTQVLVLANGEIRAFDK